MKIAAICMGVGLIATLIALLLRDWIRKFMADINLTKPTDTYSYRSTVLKSECEVIPLDPGWFALRHTVVADNGLSPDEAKGKRRIMYGKWYSIQGEGKPIYRLLRFAPNIKGGEIVVDRHGWLELCDYASDDKEALELKIEPATIWQKWTSCWWNHPKLQDRLAIRIATILGLISVGQGIIALGLGKNLFSIASGLIRFRDALDKW